VHDTNYCIVVLYMRVCLGECTIPLYTSWTNLSLPTSSLIAIQ